MIIFLSAPTIDIKVENPYLRMGKSLNWTRLEVSGFALVKISCPDIRDWKPMYLWINKPKQVSLIAPINSKLIAESWYPFNYSKKEFQIADSDWVVKTPVAKIIPTFDVEMKSFLLINLTSAIKSFSYLQPLFFLKQKNTIRSAGLRLLLKHNTFSISYSISRFKKAIYLKRFSLNPKTFYKDENLKDE